jgi:hypothetical protein
MSTKIVEQGDGRYDIHLFVADSEHTGMVLRSCTLQDIRHFVSDIVTAYRQFVGRYEVMTREEWSSLSPQARHDLNVMQMELEEAQSDRDTLRKQIEETKLSLMHLRENPAMRMSKLLEGTIDKIIAKL